jgi:ATP-dependent NAD(P)H-hydrate dehydratase
MTLAVDPSSASSSPLSPDIGVSPSARMLRVEDYLALFARSVPDLERPDLYKGATGRLAIVGGSTEYTGAPYFAAMAALRAGGELAHVFCAAAAAGPIKSYSPELIVHPAYAGMANALTRMHAVILGPGLGRDDDAREVVRQVLAAAVHEDTRWPLVMDADALWFLAQDAELRELLRTPLAHGNGPRVYISPNAVELDRLCHAVGVSDALALVHWFRNDAEGYGRVICVAKGRRDVVACSNDRDIGTVKVIIDKASGSKRCGGQGDVLSGLIGLFAGWSAQHIRDLGMEGYSKASTLNITPEITAVAPAIAASVTNRIAAKRAFGEHGRSMVASDMLAHVGYSLDIAISRLSPDHA